MKKRNSFILGSSLAIALILLVGTVTQAAKPVKTEIWYNGQVVRTILPPAANPNEGRDAFYMVPGTGDVAAVAPGDVGYHGGQWAVYVVSWNVAMYPLTSESAIWAAEQAGDIEITRNADADFLCPIQP